MLARHLVFRRYSKRLETSLIVCRGSHKVNRPLHNPVKPIFHRNVRCLTTNTVLKKNVPIFLGLSVAGGAIAAWVLRKKREPSGVVDEKADDEFEYPPFVHEHLQEDLTLLSEFGPIPYLLVGAGSASFTAYRAIRTRDPTAKVLMIGDEPFFPYMRPPLSKEMWFDSKSDVSETLSFTQWDGKSRSLFYEPDNYYFTVKDLLENKNGGITVIRGEKIVKIDPSSQVAYLDKGEKISYHKCLVATGSKPKNLPVFESVEDSVKKHITVFRTIRDFQKLEKISKKVKSIIIVGGGLLGSEMACGLAKRGGDSGLEVIQVFPESGNMGKILPEYLSLWTSKKLTNEGVKVISKVNVKSVAKDGNEIELHLTDGQVLKADHVIVAVGADPNTEIAKASGLEIDGRNGGFLVNPEMKARENLWIAGDCACFFDINLGRRRVEHHDFAVVSGRLAGENMTGNAKPYSHQSMFWSDMGPHIGFEAIGIVDSSLPTIGVFVKANEIDCPKSSSVTPVEDKKETGSKYANDMEEGIPPGTEQTSTSVESPVARPPQSSDKYSKGVIFYTRDDIVVGILLWNVFGKMQIARQIINESKSYDDIAEVAKLFELNSLE